MIQPTNPHDQAIQRLKDRREGAGGGLKKRIDKKLKNQKSKQYLWGKENRQPEEIPLDSTYIREEGAANRQQENEKTNTHWARQQMEAEYGFENPGTNPFSRAALLQRSYKNAQRISSGSYGVRGQLHSGAYQRRIGSDDFNFAAAQDSLEREYATKQRGFLERDTQSDLDRQTARETALGEAHVRAQEIPIADAPAAPPMVRKFVNKKSKRFAALKSKGKDDKAAKIKKELQGLGAWKPAKIKKLRKKTKRKKGKK